MEESLPVKAIGNGPPAEESTALGRAGVLGLISILKELETEKSLATDPVVVAPRYWESPS